MSLTINIIPKYSNLRSNNKFRRVFKDIQQNCYLLNIINLLYLGDNLLNKPISKLI